MNRVEGIEMAMMTKKKQITENFWKCDFCKEEKDTLYFHGIKQICESCRKEKRNQRRSHVLFEM